MYHDLKKPDSLHWFVIASKPVSHSRVNGEVSSAQILKNCKVAGKVWAF